MFFSRESAPNSPGLWREEDLWEARSEPMARRELIERFRPYAKSIALRYRGTAERTEDLIQVANLGLLNAIDRYDPESGSTFLAFASPTVHGELKRHFRDRVSSLRLPRAIYERVGKIEATVGQLRSDLGTEPSSSDIAQLLGCSRDEVEEALEATRSRHPAPLWHDEGEDGVSEEHLGSDDRELESSEIRLDATRALKMLSGDDRSMIELRFKNELSQSQIADRMGCSQMQVSRKLRQILDRLEKAMETDEAEQTQPKAI